MDPNRVLDIMLDAFEYHPNEENFFIALLNAYLSHYEKSTMCHILGFKFQFYKVKWNIMPINFYSDHYQLKSFNIPKSVGYMYVNIKRGNMVEDL